MPPAILFSGIAPIHMMATSQLLPRITFRRTIFTLARERIAHVRVSHSELGVETLASIHSDLIELKRAAGALDAGY